MSQESNRRRAGKTPGLFGCCLGVPILAVLALGILYVLHNRAPDLTVPMPQLPANNAYDDFVQAGQLAKRMKHLSPYSMPTRYDQDEETFANFAACAKDAIPVLARMRQGLNKPCMAPLLRSYSTSISPFILPRELARAVAGEAKYHELCGHPGIAADHLLDGLEMSAMLPIGGSLIAGNAGRDCEETCAELLEPLLNKLSDKELAQTAIRLEKIKAKRVPYADILEEEANSMTAIMVEALRDPKTRGFYGLQALNSPSTDDEAPSMNWMERLQGFQYALADKERMIIESRDYLKALAKEARQPYRDKSNVSPPSNFLFQIFAGDGDGYQHSRERFLGMEAQLEIFRAEVALLRYRKAHGRYPASLSQVVPRYLPALPDDPFGGSTNHPFTYKPVAGGKSYLLYSLGPDMKDDGGKPTKYPGDKPGDIVAGKLWAPRPKPAPPGKGMGGRGGSV